MRRPLSALLLGSLLTTSVPALADRRSARNTAPAEDEDAADEDMDGPEATGTYTVTIDQLIDASIRSSPELARSKADRTVSQSKALGARGSQGWVATADAKYDRFSVGGDAPLESIAPASVVDQRKFDVSLGLQRNIPTGGSIGLQLAFNRTGLEYALSPELFDPNADGVVDGKKEFEASHQTTAQLQFKQSLGRGFGPNVALADQKRADMQFLEQTIKTQLAAEDLILQVITNYWELSYAQTEVEARQTALEYAKQLDKATHASVAAQVQPKSALNESAYSLATSEEALLRAELAYEKVSLEIRRQVGLGIGNREVVLKAGDPMEIDDKDWDVDEVLAASRQTNRKIAAIILQKKTAEIDVAVAKNGMLPQIDLTLSGGLLGKADSTGEAFSRAFGADGFQLIADLSIQIDLSGAAKHNYEAAQAQKSRIEVDRVDAERVLETQIVQAVHQVNSARKRVELSTTSVETSEINLASERGKFASGAGSLLSISQRQNDFVESQVRRGRAAADYHIAVAQLESLSGTLLPAYGVDVRANRRK